MNNGLAILGGSFDPIHLGHVKTALDIQKIFHFKKIIFMPCGQAVFKNQLHVSDADRLAMLKIALHDSPQFMMDTREMMRQGPSYTILSLEELRTEYGKQVSLTWILGEDAFQEFENWYRYQDILSFAHLIILARPKLKKNFSKSLDAFVEKHLTDNPEDLIQAPQGKIYFYHASNYPISSSEIREDIHNQILPHGLAPEVLEYIQEHACYQTQLKTNY
ncbi:MAG TPA: hypothetical protein DCZ80_00525 [Legionellales bacterium]|nr:hypothetical protein [Legionellales bacterium]